MFFIYKDTQIFYRYILSSHTESRFLAVLPGWGASGNVYSALSAEFSDRYNILYIDYPPFGLSATPPPCFGLEDYAALTVQILKHCGILQCDLFCHSFGARVAAVLCGGGIAAANGVSVGKLLITGGAGLRPRFSLKRSFKRLLYRAHKLMCGAGILPYSGLYRHFSADYRALDQNTRMVFKSIVRRDLSIYFGYTQNPTLLIYGEQDRETPSYMGKKLAKIMPNSHLVVLPGCGHYCFADDAAAFFASAKQFLSG